MRFAVLALLLAGVAVYFVKSSATAPAAPTAPSSAPPSPAEELKRLGTELYAGQCPQYGRAPRETFEGLLADQSLANGKRIPLQLDLATKYLEAGEVERAIKLLEETLELAQKSNNGRQERKVVRDLARAWLREAENKNCIERHNADCCIFPPRGGAIHSVRGPAETALKLYRAVLADQPENLAVRWLVNVTTLVLGESLDELPEGQRIPMHAFGECEGEPLFRDVASDAGVDVSSLAGGVAVEDFDGDGWYDILTSTCDPLGSMHYFHSRGDGTFEDRSESSGVSGELGGLNMLSADYDADGDQDALVLRGGWLLDYGQLPRSLLRNDEGTAFVDVSHEAGLWGPAQPTMAAAFGDYDDDGDLDLYVGNESRVEIEEGKGNYPSQLYVNDGSGTFRDDAVQAGVTNDRYAKGVAAGDYDDDGDLDLYVSNIGYNRLYRNDGKARFADVAAEAGVLEPAGRSFACWFFDYDQDGHLDLWVNAYSATIGDLAADALFLPHNGALSCLYRNRADGRFENVAARMGLDHPWLAMGANFGDVDGDGWLDVYLGTGDPLLESLMPDVLLRNDQGKRFLNETGSSGLGHLQKGHGIGFADFDGDGDQDIFHKMGGFVPVDAYANVLFENRSSNGHHWLSLSLAGTRTNRDAVGARVKVELETPAGPRTLYRAVGSVSSFGGSPHRLEIGLGDATRIARLEIRWPRTSEPQVFTDVGLDSWFAIREGEPALQRREVKSFHF